MKRLLLLSLLLAGCTTISATSGAPAGTPAPTIQPADTVPPADTIPPDYIEDACFTQLGPLYTAESDLSGRLDVGITEPNYQVKLGDVSVAYNGLRLTGLSSNCLSKIGVPLEDAFKAYTTAGTLWNDCITSTSCTNASVKPKLQAQWTIASGRIAVVKLLWP